MTLSAQNTVINAQDIFAKKQEQEWIINAKAGDRQAFNHLYQENIGKVYALCFRMLSSRDQAEDVAQEVFVQVWLKLENFRGDAKFSTWLHAVATNTALTHMRKQKNWLQKVFSIEEQPQAEPAGNEIQDLSDLDKLILRLPEKARVVFVLFAVEGYRHEEIATMLNMAVGSSKSHYHRARNLLKDWLEAKESLNDE
ncbi:RNA polymerase sigma factor [Thalassotalea sp. ND16A]|uniref:RNA polymerase sigma factor n=1 Tax=Thalassotalea sp. ND16A TaxID=1535422 RepID=UPI00051A7B4C|nr:RNA polymerase sigma factor [Thalassotalea sp. ND16A]KGK00801.1 RNA polymerase, sigma-24 subunit, ECF subfamily [Thalassotalea sp. ND16A]